MFLYNTPGKTLNKIIKSEIRFYVSAFLMQYNQYIFYLLIHNILKFFNKSYTDNVFVIIKRSIKFKLNFYTINKSKRYIFFITKFKTNIYNIS